MRNLREDCKAVYMLFMRQVSVQSLHKSRKKNLYSMLRRERGPIELKT
jgi:hypothetical protein